MQYSRSGQSEFHVRMKPNLKRYPKTLVPASSMSSSGTAFRSSRCLPWMLNPFVVVALKWSILLPVGYSDIKKRTVILSMAFLGPHAREFIHSVNIQVVTFVATQTKHPPHLLRLAMVLHR